MKQIFALKQDLEIPIDQYSKALFLASEVGMSYRVDLIDHIKEQIKISLILVDKATTNLVKELTTQTYDATGDNGALLNPDEYNTYLADKTELEQMIKDLDEQIEELIKLLEPMELGEEKAQMQEELEFLRSSRQEASNDLAALSVVDPVYEKKNTYQEIVGYIANGMLTPEGIVWGTSLRFQGVPIGALIIV
jgi:hypothetical protein